LPPHIEPQQTKKWMRIIICIFVGILIGIALSFGVLKLSKDGIVGDTSNSLIQANMSNWGFAVIYDDKLFFSDGSTGIYYLNGSEQKVLFIEGSYSDMGLLDDIIYCVESCQTNDGSYAGNVIVAINIINGAKRIIYEPPSIDTQLIGDNVVDNKYFFSVDYDTLYSVNLEGEVENTGIRYARKVTESGIYTTDTSTYGLKLLSFDGKILESYPKLSKYEVEVCFELGDNVYLRYTDEDLSKIYCMDKKMGKVSVFPNDESLFDKNIASYINYYKGNFYLSTSKVIDNAYEYNVYLIDSSGNNVRLICSERNEGGLPLPFCPINIVDNYLVVTFPFTGIESQIMRLDNITSN